MLFLIHGLGPQSEFMSFSFNLDRIPSQGAGETVVSNGEDTAFVKRNRHGNIEVRIVPYFVTGKFPHDRQLGELHGHMIPFVPHGYTEMKQLQYKLVFNNSGDCISHRPGKNYRMTQTNAKIILDNKN